MTFYEEFLAGHLVVPGALLSHFSEIFDSGEDFLVWLYFLRDREIAPSQIAAHSGKTLTEVNAAIKRLQAIEALKVTLLELNGQTDMIFDVSPAFARLDQLDAPEQKANEGQLQELATAFEAEMGVISPIQLEELRSWLEEDKYDSRLILAALKEAALNRKVSLSYIRAILRNWRSDGIMTTQDIKEREALRNPAPNSVASFTIPVEGPWNNDK